MTRANGIGLENVTGNEDPFDNLPATVGRPHGNQQPNWTMGEEGYRRQQIVGYYENGATGFEAAHGLSIGIAGFTREVRLMASKGFFTTESKMRRRRALMNVAA